METIPARRGKATYLTRGHSIRIVNTHGAQVVDTWAFTAGMLTEFMSMEHTRATLTSLRRALGAVGRRINPEEDVVLLHLTSHGSQNHELSVEFYPLQLQAIRPADVRAALDDAGIKWRIVVVSACYSGGFIDALKDTHALVIAASDANHTSFGCGDAFDFTYFSQAYYDGALRGTYSFEQAFGIARQAIPERIT